MARRNSVNVPDQRTLSRFVLISAVAGIIVACSYMPVPLQSKSNGQPTAQASPVRFTHVGYNTGLHPDNRYEHIHLCDASGSMIDVSGWRINNPATGDTFVFPAGRQGPRVYTSYRDDGQHACGRERGQRA